MDDKFDLVVRGGTVVFPGEVRRSDIGVRGGKIAAVADGIGTGLAAEDVDAEGHLVMAGVIDAHVHLNEPNFGHWEGFETGTAALAAGGCTAYADMPLNGNPPTVTLESLWHKNELAKQASSVDYALWGGLVPWNLDCLEELAAAGVIGFKAFMSNPGGEGEGRFREVEKETLHEGMRRIATFGGLLALHAESDEMTSALAARALAEGRTGAADFAASRPGAAELEAVNDALAMAEETGCRLHFVHISSPQAVEVITAAKRRGMDVTVETCPHYLVLTEEDMERLGAVAKCAPPLRSEELREGMWKKLLAGEIDWIASDHSPCPEAMKIAPGLSFFSAWGGIAGAQSSLELMLEEGWVKRGVPLPLLSKLMSANPARRFGLYPRKGEISVGFDADLAIVALNREHTLCREDLLQRHPHSPYIGKSFSCKVAATMCRGKVVYAEGRGIIKPGEGEWIRPIVSPDV